MFLHLHQPAAPLGLFVELITYYGDYHPEHRREKLLPDGAVEIIIDLTDEPKRLYDRHDFRRSRAFHGAWISGMRSRWIVIEAAPGSSMAVIRFRPGGAYRVLGFDVQALTNQVDSLEQVLGRLTASLRERVLEAHTAAAKMAVIEQWLCEKIRGNYDPHPIVGYVAQRLFAPAGLRISHVVEELGYTQRYISRLFQRWVGMSPKQYSRIRRFQQTLGYLTATQQKPDVETAALLQAAPLDEPDWADVAACNGYYDQSHLIHEFQEFSGMTPGAYARAYRGQENYLPL